MGAMRKFEEMTISDVLKRVLKLTRVRRMIGGVQQWRWIPTNVQHLIKMKEVMAGDVWGDDPGAEET